MTTFTTEDRIFAQKDGSLTINVKAGEVILVNKDLSDQEITEIVRLGLDEFRTNLIKVQDK